ncbi:MAG TPA: hypothetical protein VJ576_17670 [Rhodocyclaceae bacterium]|nr:hypothetical protein [Rhodocyclaceae bacterium]
MAKNEHDQTADSTRALAKKVDAIGWGLFFIWIGIAFLADVGWGAGIVGVGVITLGSQAVRNYLRLPIERFWLAMGIVFTIWGAWELLHIQVGEVPIHGGLLPILFIGLGIVIIVSAVLRKSR